MRIAQIKGYDLPVPPIKGGAIEHWIYEVVTRLKSHQRIVFSIKPESCSANEAIIDGINYQWFRLTAFQDLISRRIGLERILQLNPFILKNRIKNKFSDIDIWHVHNTPFIIPFLKKICPRAKMILHLHSSFPSLIKTTLPRDLKPYYRYIDCVVTVSEFIKEEVLNYIPNTIRTAVIYNGVDTDRFKPVSPEKATQIKQKYNIPPDKRIILYAGRIVPEKGVHVLVEAMEKIVNRNRKVLLIIAGSHFFSDSSMKTPYILELRKKTSKILNNVIFLGYIKQSELANLYAIADICVVPSLCKEACAGVNLEAQASQVAVIASNVGGIPEIVIDGVTGMLTHPGDWRALAYAIALLLEDKGLRMTLGQNGRKHILSKFSWDHTVRKCAELYLSICQQNH